MAEGWDAARILPRPTLSSVTAPPACSPNHLRPTRTPPEVKAPPRPTGSAAPDRPEAAAGDLSQPPSQPGRNYDGRGHSADAPGLAGCASDQVTPGLSEDSFAFVPGAPSHQRQKESDSMSHEIIDVDRSDLDPDCRILRPKRCFARAQDMPRTSKSVSDASSRP